MLRQVPAYFGGSPRGELRLAVRFERLGGTEAVVALAFREQPIGVIDVRLHALGLAVRAVGAAGLDPFVPLQAHPAQIVENRLLGLARRALEIGVFDAEDERAVLAARQQPVEQRRSGVTDVQMACRGRGETNSHE